MKPKPKPTFTWEEVDAIRSASAMADEPTPEYAFTIHDYLAQYSLTPSTAAKQLDKLVKAGKLQMGYSRRPGEDGRISRMKVFWPKE